MRHVLFVLIVIVSVVWGLAAWLKDQWLPGLSPVAYWGFVVGYVVVATVLLLRGVGWVASMMRRNARRDSSGGGQ